MREKNILKEKDDNLSGDDVREGLSHAAGSTTLPWWRSCVLIGLDLVVLAGFMDSLHRND